MTSQSKQTNDTRLSFTGNGGFNAIYERLDEIMKEGKVPLDVSYEIRMGNKTQEFNVNDQLFKLTSSLKARQLV